MHTAFSMNSANSVSLRTTAFDLVRSIARRDCLFGALFRTGDIVADIRSVQFVHESISPSGYQHPRCRCMVSSWWSCNFESMSSPLSVRHEFEWLVQFLLLLEVRQKFRHGSSFEKVCRLRSRHPRLVSYENNFLPLLFSRMMLSRKALRTDFHRAAIQSSEDFRSACFQTRVESLERTQVSSHLEHQHSSVSLLWLFLSQQNSQVPFHPLAGLIAPIRSCSVDTELIRRVNYFEQEFCIRMESFPSSVLRIPRLKALAPVKIGWFVSLDCCTRWQGYGIPLPQVCNFEILTTLPHLQDQWTSHVLARISSRTAWLFLNSKYKFHHFSSLSNRCCWTLKWRWSGLWSSRVQHSATACGPGSPEEFAMR